MVAALAATSLVLVGCAVPARHFPTYQPIRHMGTVTADTLGLRPGTSRLQEAMAALKAVGVSNVVTARGLDAADDKVTIDAVSGDNLAEVLLFRNLVFHAPLDFGADAGTATRLYLKVTRTERRTAVIVVSPDLKRAGQHVLAVLLDRHPPRRYFINVDSSHFPDWAGGSGMADPLINGDDLGQTGVTFVARGTDGYPWRSALVLRCDGANFSIETVAMQQVLGCTCLSDWYWKSTR